MRRALIVTTLTLLLLLVVAAAVRPMTAAHPDFARQWDHHNYIAMATAPDSAAARVAPYSYRVLTPALARALPFGVQDNFRLITFVALWLTMIAMYYLFRAYGLSDPSAAFGLLLWSSMWWGVSFTLTDFWLCDPLLFLSTTLALLAIRRGNALAFAVVLALGVTNKETAWAVAPLWFTVAGREKWREGALALLPAVAVTAGLRLTIAGEGLSVLETMKMTLQGRYFDLYAYTYGTFGIAVLLPLLSPARALRFAVPYAPFIALVYAQLLVANNTERLLVVAAPVVLLCGLTAMEARLAVRGTKRAPQRALVRAGAGRR